MKRIIFWIALLLAIALLAPGSAFALPAQVTVGHRTGTSGTLDALECEDILSVSPPATPRAIATGDRAVSWGTDGLVCMYLYNATGTASESDPTIIVPNDRADCSNQGQWEMQACVSEDIYSLAAGITGVVLGGGAGSGYSAAVDGIDYVKTKLTANTDLNEKAPFEDYYPCDDDCVSSNVVNLTGKGIHVKFDDSGTDEDTINSFSGQTSGAWYHFAFIDEYWTIAFSQANLFGHNELDWEPTAGDSMLCYSIDGTNLYCQVSRPTALAVNMYYDLPFDSIPDADDRWHGPTAEYENGSGSALNQWDLVYLRPDGASQEGALWPWDGNLATYKYFKPIGVVIESGGIADGNIGTVGILGGIGRHDAWAFTDNSDEGKTVYGSNTAGVLTLTAPSTAGDIACAVGRVIDAHGTSPNVIQFNFGLCTTTEVGE